MMVYGMGFIEWVYWHSTIQICTVRYHNFSNQILHPLG